MLNCGIVGLPLSGKSTIFNVLTNAGVEVKSYPGGRTDPNRAVVEVPDERFDHLASHFAPKKATHATVEFVDLAGLSKNAGKGEGLGNSFLSFVSESDALIHVLRLFENPDVPHPEGGIDPVRDWEIVELELIFRDLSVIENRLSRMSEKKKNIPAEAVEKELLERCQTCLLEERPLRELSLNQEEMKLLSGFAFVTMKPEIIVANLDETQTGESDPHLSAVMTLAKEKGIRLVRVFGKMEMELAELPREDRGEFMDELGLSAPGRNRLISEAYSLLGLISFFTIGKDEVKAWTLRKGQNALEAAGTIHTDMARGFIRAQVVSYEDFIKNDRSMPKCRESGVLRLEGKEYPVADGDMIEIRFNI
ncbi:MAG: redox-regulated ATPase YchF [Synergistaceae bacterium]|nr:redox-regulated ATPase YchF [Synergistaceae bacterium]